MLEVFKMWGSKITQKISWTERINDDVLKIIIEKQSLIDTLVNKTQTEI